MDIIVFLIIVEALDLAWVNFNLLAFFNCDGIDASSQSVKIFALALGCFIMQMRVCFG